MSDQGAKVYRHADADKKEPQQQTFKGFNIAFQRMTVFRACQQHASQERPHRHGKASLFQQQTEAEYQKQRHGAEHFT